MVHAYFNLGNFLYEAHTTVWTLIVMLRTTKEQQEAVSIPSKVSPPLVKVHHPCVA